MDTAPRDVKLWISSILDSNVYFCDGGWYAQNNQVYFCSNCRDGFGISNWVYWLPITRWIRNFTMICEGYIIKIVRFLLWLYVIIFNLREVDFFLGMISKFSFKLPVDVQALLDEQRYVRFFILNNSKYIFIYYNLILLIIKIIFKNS